MTAPPNPERSSRIAMLLLCGVLFVLPLALSSSIVFHPDAVFAFNDGNIEMVLSPAYAYPRAMLQIWDNQFFFGAGWAAPLNVSSMGEWLLGPHRYRTWGVPLAAWFVGLCGLWCARRLGMSVAAAWLAALLFTLCGWSFTFPTVGLPVRSFTLGWSLLSVGMMVSARQQGSWLRYALAGGFLGLAVSDTPDVGIFFALSLAACFVVLHVSSPEEWRLNRLLRHSGALALYVAASLLMAWQTVSIMYGMNIEGVADDPAPESVEERYAWATQWSLPPAETWSLLAPDYHGASSRSEASPYWGRMGQTAGWEEHRQGFRNFRMAGYALGTTAAVCIPLLWILLFSPLGRRTFDRDARMCILLFTGLGAVSLMLAWGRHFPLYRLFFSLPFMSTIRNPDKWLGPFTLAAGLLFGYAADALLSLREKPAAETRGVIRAWLACSGALMAIAVLGALRLLARRGAFLDTLSEMGYGDAAMLQRMFGHALGANVLFVVLAAVVLTVGTTYLRLVGGSRRNALLFLVAGLAAVTTFDLWSANKPFVLPAHYRHILQRNPMTDFFDAHRSEGRIKILPPQHPLLNNWRLTYLMAHGYDLFDPVSVRQMPPDYGALFNGFGDRVDRLWQLGAVRYFLCLAQTVPQLQAIAPPGTRFVERAAFGAVGLRGHAVPSAQVPDDQKLLRIVEFDGALPLHRLVGSWEALPDSPEGQQEAIARLAAPVFDLRRTAIVHGEMAPMSREEEGGGRVATRLHSSTESHLDVETSSEMLLVRAVKFDPAWRVSVAGKPAELLRVNALFQGVRVPAGVHRVAFEYRPSRTLLHKAIGVRLLFLGALLGLSVPRRMERFARSA